MASNTQVLPDVNVTDKPMTDSNDNIYEDQTIGAELTKKISTA